MSDSRKITLYISTVIASKEVKKQQKRMIDVLDTYKIEYEIVDVAEAGKLQLMRDTFNNQTLLAPQLGNGGYYCGNYEAFEYAVEDKLFKQFLKLED